MDDYDGWGDYGGGDESYLSNLDYSQGSDSGEGMDLGLNYGDSGGGGGDPYLSNLDYSQEGGGGTFNPDEYLASRGGYTPPQESSGALSNMSDAFMKHLKSNPVSVLSQLLGAGSSLYSTMQGSKQRADLARQIKDARDARDAKRARYGAVLPMQMNREMLPNQGDLLTAGQRPGGMNWFTPTKFTNMAEGGAVKPSWLDSLFARKPVPAVVGTGTAAKAGDAIQNRGYQLYKQTQEMNDAIPLPYETWVQLQQQGKGMAAGGALSRMVRGPGDGTSDSVPINAADGEYVFDAESVSALGNGSNQAGAKVLDDMRKRLRAHKRSAPVNKIAPDAKSPEDYMRGGK